MPALRAAMVGAFDTVVLLANADGTFYLKPLFRRDAIPRSGIGFDVAADKMSSSGVPL